MTRAKLYACVSRDGVESRTPCLLPPTILDRMSRKAATTNNESNWVKVADTDELWSPASSQPEPVADPSPALLPTHEMAWEAFERLVLAMARYIEGAFDVRIYGKRGQRQHGIDIVGFFPLPRQPSVYQGKREEAFGAGALEAAVEQFTGDRRPFGADRIVVAVAPEARDTATIEKLHELRSRHPDLQIDLWDRNEISEQLRKQPYLVARFSGTATAAAFCDQPQPVVATGVSSIEADAVLRGPVAHLGLQDKLRRASELRTEQPSESADAYADVADRLEAAGFRPHADVVRDLEAGALQLAGRLNEEAWVRIALGWRQLTAGDAFSAKMQVREVVQRSHQPDDVRRGLEALGAAVGVQSEYHVKFEDMVEAFDALHPTDRHFVDAALVLGEHAIARRRPDFVASRAERLREAADSLPSTVEGERDAARLRMCIADSTGEWEPFASSARTTYSPSTTPWILARHARHLALEPNAEASISRYLDAIERACIEGLNDDAADWLYAMRDVRVWAGMVDGNINDPHRHAQALRAAGSGTVLRESYPARERGLNQLRERKWPDALESLHRYVWRATVVADLGGEVEGNELLADVFQATGRVLEATRHYVISGQSKKLDSLAASLPEQSIDVSTDLLTPRPWERAAAYKFIETAADLVADSAAIDWCTAALNEVLTGGPPSRSLAANPWLAAFLAFGRLSAIASEDEGARFIEYAAPLVPREPKHYRFTDEAHVRALIGIARKHLGLAPRAIEQLLSALAADQRMADIVLSEADDLLRADPDRTGELVGGVATNGNFHAALAVVIAGGATAAAVPEARRRFEAAIAPRERKPGVMTFGTLLPDTARLVTVLPNEDRVRFARAMLERAGDDEDTPHNRQDALLALRPIASDLADDVRDELFDSVVPFAEGKVVASQEPLFPGADDPLGRFRFSLGDVSLKNAGLLAAAALVRSAEQAQQIHRVATRNLRQADHAGANVIAHALGGLPREYLEMSPAEMARHANEWLRALGAVVWSESPDDEEIGLELAHDSSPHVRRSLAANLTSDFRHAGVRAVLSRDPRRSVRMKVESPAGATDISGYR